MIYHKNEFLNFFEPLYKSIKEFTFFHQFIRDDLRPKPTIIGINAQSSSIARKDFTIQRINEEIKLRNLPIEIVETNAETTFFKLMLKKENEF